MNNSPDDIALRRPIWLALSELFVDGELFDEDRDRIAASLAASDFDPGDLEKILFQDVFPVLIQNLRMPAGNWTGFQIDEIERDILQHRAKRLTLPLQLIPGYRQIREEWERVRALLPSSGGLGNV